MLFVQFALLDVLCLLLLYGQRRQSQSLLEAPCLATAQACWELMVTQDKPSSMNSF
jgi:hypothetical protein